MNLLFQINHPAHYHLFRNVIKILKSKGHTVSIVARKKDVLEELFANEEYSMISTPKGRNIIQKIRLHNAAKNNIIELTKKYNPDLVIGTGTFSYITRNLGIPTLFFAEDDVTINFPIFFVALLHYPYFSEIIAPKVCNNLFWNKRTVNYQGYHELSYLHPKHFAPDKKIVEKYFSTDKKYFIMRFAKLNAYHDIGIKGINYKISKKLIDILKQYGDIYITSERELEPELEKYRIQINPIDMHHVLAFADIYIGDSQTMAAEAGVLGTPFIRYNDFVGKIGYLSELEDVYKLGFGIRTKKEDKLINTIEDLLKMKNKDKVFSDRKQKMLSEKIDVAEFFVWFIENYPESSKVIKENPEYSNRFK